MKLSRCGICSRSEGTSVEPSRAGSRLKCVLSKMIVTTWLTFPRGELSWQPAAELKAGVAAATRAAAPRAGEVSAPVGPAHARAIGYTAKNTAVPRASARRPQLSQLLVFEPPVFRSAKFLPAKIERNFINSLLMW